MLCSLDETAHSLLAAGTTCRCEQKQVPAQSGSLDEFTTIGNAHARAVQAHGKAVADPGNEEPASPLRWETALKDQVERVPAWRRAWPTPWHAGPALPLPRRPPRRPLSARAHHAPRRSPDVWGPGREAVRDLSHVADGSKAIAPQIMQPVSLVLVAKAEIGNLRGFAGGTAGACSPAPFPPSIVTLGWWVSTALRSLIGVSSPAWSM